MEGDGCMNEKAGGEEGRGWRGRKRMAVDPRVYLQTFLRVAHDCILFKDML